MQWDCTSTRHPRLGLWGSVRKGRARIGPVGLLQYFFSRWCYYYRVSYYRAWRTVYISLFMQCLLIRGFNPFRILMSRKKWLETFFFSLMIDVSNCNILGHVQIIENSINVHWTFFFHSEIKKKFNKQSIASLFIHHNTLIHHKSVST